MGVKGRGLEHLGEGKLHLVGERGEVGGGNLLVAVLDEMQMLDQEVAAPRPVTEQCGNLFGGLGIDLASLGSSLGPAAPLTRMLERADLVHIITHRDRLVFIHSTRIWTLIRGMPDANSDNGPPLDYIATASISGVCQPSPAYPR